MSPEILWKRFQQYGCRVPALGLSLDISRMRFEDGFLERMAAPMQRAFEPKKVSGTLHLVPIGRRSTSCRVPGTLFGQSGQLIGPAVSEEMML